MTPSTNPPTTLPPGTFIPKPAEYRCPCGKKLHMQCTDNLWRCVTCAYAYEAGRFEERAAQAATVRP